MERNLWCRNLFVFLNFVLMIASLILFSISVYVLSKYEIMTLFYGISIMAYLQCYPCLISAVLFSLAILGIYGNTGTAKVEKWITGGKISKFYNYSTVTIIIFNILIITLINVHKREMYLLDKAQVFIKYQYGLKRFHQSSREFDRFQTSNECCGLSGPRDWINSHYMIDKIPKINDWGPNRLPTKNVLPTSCCKGVVKTVVECNYYDENVNVSAYTNTNNSIKRTDIIATKGCGFVISSIVKTYNTILLILIGTSIIIQVICLTISCCFLNHLTISNSNSALHKKIESSKAQIKDPYRKSQINGFIYTENDREEDIFLKENLHEFPHSYYDYYSTTHQPPTSESDGPKTHNHQNSDTDNPLIYVKTKWNPSSLQNEYTETLDSTQQITSSTEYLGIPFQSTDDENTSGPGYDWGQFNNGGNNRFEGEPGTFVYVQNGGLPVQQLTDFLEGTGEETLPWENTITTGTILQNTSVGDEVSLQPEAFSNQLDNNLITINNDMTTGIRNTEENFVKLQELPAQLNRINLQKSSSKINIPAGIKSGKVPHLKQNNNKRKSSGRSKA